MSRLEITTAIMCAMVIVVFLTMAIEQRCNVIVSVHWVGPWHLIRRRAKLGYYRYPDGWGFNLPLVGFTVERYWE